METQQVRHRIVFLDRGVFPFDLKRPRFPHVWIEYRTTRQEDVVDRLVAPQSQLPTACDWDEPSLRSFPICEWSR